MTKRLFTVMVLMVVLVALFAVSSYSRAKYDPSPTYNPTSVTLKKYAFPQVRFKRVAWGDVASPADDAAAENPVRRASIGSAMSPTSAASPGFTVVQSYNDDQMFPGGNRQVDFRGPTPSVHFVYGAATATTLPGKFGYNVYDPLACNWPRGAGVGCEVQASDGEGWWDNMDLSPKGYVVIGGDDDASGSLDNHFFWQSSQHSCFWGTGAQIAPSQYNVNFLTPSNYLAQLRMEYQIVGTDTVLHVLAVESAPTNMQGDLDGNTLSYFRKVGNGALGTWSGPITIDTMNRSSGSQSVSNGSISASRVSSKVLIAYTHFHDQAFVHDQRYDVEVFYALSNDGGVTWLTHGQSDIDPTFRPEMNITNYSRIEPSGLAFINTHSLIDSEDGLHVIWTAGLTVANVYSDASYFWGDFSASLYHWTDRVAGPNAGGTITKAHNADWGIDYNTQVCGFPSPGLSYIGYESIAECDGHIYLFASQYNDAFGDWGVPHIDDCASGFSDRLFAANGEVFMVVSTTLNGILWDAARNLTNTYTPDCDSAGYGGTCMNDGRATVSRFGMDSAAYGAALCWPGDELVMPSNSEGWSGSKYLHLFYTEDHYPAPGWRSLQGDAPADYNMVTFNPLKWMRIPCVAPIPAARITVSDDYIGRDNNDWLKPTETLTRTITVTNEGNVQLDVGSIVDAETSPATNWLSVTETGLTIPAGVDNQRTFDLTIDGTVSGVPGTTILHTGTVTLNSNAANNPAKVIDIDILVTDTVVFFEFDTVNTAITHMVVSTGGEMGNNGGNNNGTVNLDYVSTGGECNPSTTDPNTSVYLYSGGPLVVHNLGGGSYTVDQGMWESNSDPSILWHRIYDPPNDPVHLTGSNYDGFFTGTFVNHDSTIAAQRTVYAPNGNTNFMIVKTDYYATGAAVSGVDIGEQVDWDIPTDRGSDNNSGIMANQYAVYLQGLDTATVAECQLNADRYGSLYFLGMHTAADTANNACASTCIPYGTYALENDTVFAAPSDVDSLGEFYWNQNIAKQGITASSEQGTDLHSGYTAVHDYTLNPGDVLTVYHAVASIHEGTLTDLGTTLDAAFDWYRVNLRPGCDQLCGCCVGLTGNVDGDSGDNVDIGDLTALIGYLFIPPYTPPACEAEANVDGAGGVDIGDLTALIGYLFIPPYTPPAPC